MTGLSHVFLSGVSSEFAGKDGEYAEVRQKLAAYLREQNFEVEVQETFTQHGGATLEKLDDYIRKCRAVVHIVGNAAGSPANEQARRRLESKLEDESHPFLSGQPDKLRSMLGDFSDLSYTQWEAFLALHHGIPLYVFSPSTGRPTEVREKHLERLLVADPKRYAVEVGNKVDLFNQVLRSLKEKFPELELPKPNNLPVSIGELFKGREEMLQKIENAVAGSPQAITQAVSGLGGIGKTRLAVEFGHQNEAKYDALLFLRADSPEALQDNLAELCGPLALNLPEYLSEKAEDRVRAALAWLGRNEKWFLILDNVDSEEAAKAAEGLLARLANGDVLITSRVSKWSTQVDKLDLGVLDGEASREFLIARAGADRPCLEGDEDALVELMVELNGLALALEQAGAYIEEEEISFGEYLIRFRRQKAEVLEWHDERLMQYPASVAVTWQTTLTELGKHGERGKEAIKVLNQLAHLAAAPVPRAAFPDHRSGISLLRRYSMVSFLTEPPDTVAVHRLVQDILRSRQDDITATQAKFEVFNAFYQWLPRGGQDISTWAQWALFKPHRTSLMREGEDDEEKLSVLLNGYASYLQCREGEYSKAEYLYHRALEIHERVLGSEHPDTLTSVNNLAELLRAKGAYGEAEPLHRRALEGRERILDSEHPDTLASVNNLAELLRIKGEYGEAEPLFRRALEVSERVLGSEHPNTLVSVNNLAALLESRGEYVEAEPLYRRALEASELVLGLEHPNTLFSVNNLAGLLEAKGAYGEAEPLYRRALEGRERILDSEHPDTLASVNNLAELLRAKGEYGEAEPLCRRALEGRERVLGPEHPFSLTSVNNLAELLLAKGAYVEAEPLYRRALEGREQVLGPKHPSTLTSVNNLAGFFYAKGEYGEAEPLFRRALEVSEQVRGPEHHYTLISVNNLAELLRRKGENDEAESLCRRALEVGERVLGPEHPFSLASVNNLAELLRAKGEYGDAKILYRRALEVSERVHGSEHPSTLTIVNNLAGLFYAKGEYGEAEPLFKRAAETIERLLGAKHPNAQTTRENYELVRKMSGK